MLSFSRKADYGLLLLTILARLPNTEYMSVRKVAKEHNLPYTFLAKIASELKEIGVVESREGLRGGFRLGTSAENISLAEIVEKLDGKVTPVACMQGKACSCSSSCTHQNVVTEISRVVEQAMADYSLADLVGGKA